MPFFFLRTSTIARVHPQSFPPPPRLHAQYALLHIADHTLSEAPIPQSRIPASPDHMVMSFSLMPRGQNNPRKMDFPDLLPTLRPSLVCIKQPPPILHLPPPPPSPSIRFSGNHPPPFPLTLAGRSLVVNVLSFRPRTLR